MRTKLRLVSRLIMAIVVAFSMVATLPPQQTSALNHVGTMYFSGSPGTVAYSNCALILNGYTGGADKGNFINFVLNAFNTPFGSGCGGGKKVGAAYIIQTMRGVGVGSNALPSASDIQDWENLIMQPSIQISTENYSYSLDTALKYNNSRLFSGVDVGMFYRSDTAPSTVFRQTGRGIVYVMRNPCGNPVGDNPGIVNMPLNYTLNPSVSVNATAVEASSSVVVSPTISNTDSATSSGTQWQLSRFMVPANGTVPAGGNSSSNPASFYGYPVDILGSGTGQAYPPGVTSLSPTNDQIPDDPVGTKVCYALSVQPRTNTDSSWAHSTPVCVTIAKKPKVEVLGGDLSVGQAFTGSVAPTTSNIDTSTTVKGTTIYGSWDEYGVNATGTVTGFGSGSAYSGGLVNGSTCIASQLIFTSAGTSACSQSTVLGNYASTRTLPDVASAFTVNSSTPQFVNLGDAAQDRVETSNSDITINGGTLQKGQWLVIDAPTKTVTITGDIHYTTDTLYSIADIPQLVIIANTINIQGGVTNIDAWLIASGTNGIVNTCTDVALTDPLTSTTCSNKLTVNGPVMAKSLYLRRTAGAGTGSNSGDPAEVFNMRPDAYLWSVSQAISANHIQSVYTQELPPRF